MSRFTEAAMVVGIAGILTGCGADEAPVANSCVRLEAAMAHFDGAAASTPDGFLTSVVSIESGKLVVGEDARNLRIEAASKAAGELVGDLSDAMIGVAAYLEGSGNPSIDASVAGINTANSQPGVDPDRAQANLQGVMRSMNNSTGPDLAGFVNYAAQDRGCN